MNDPNVYIVTNSAEIHSVWDAHGAAQETADEINDREMASIKWGVLIKPLLSKQS